MQGKCVFFVFVRECAGCGVIWSNFLHFLKLVSKLYFRKLYIVDARPRKNALANGAMGGGSKSSSNYFQSEVVLLGIDNIHAMRDLFGFENTWTLISKRHQMEFPLSCVHDNPTTMIVGITCVNI
ncbi:uncharacterized protein LOC124824561 [Vigna umbellata]|uniref:uncharacterized protein LOC124824561 n=1 Tax=Vigna umbellata TaxID=87088 RepID=UPI001F5EA8F8|nr:uncharacterized protein LOC124824561 [Vigna umbellata]